MEIDSIVANSALIKAREGGRGKGRSWKWKDMLRFPQISQCFELSMGIERDYRSMCVEQPIGRQLFRLFCRSRPDLQNYISLQEALDAFETKLDEERKDFGISIIQRFIRSESIQCVAAMLIYERRIIDSLQKDPCSDVFQDAREELHNYLSKEPFLQYQESMFFDRFLQWKTLERHPITKQSFRQYRLLGKGGFGEVWACQVRATGMMYACKKLEKTHVKKRRGETMALNEKEILEALDSRFVVNLAYAYETKHALCMVLTMMSGGDLRFHIYNMGQNGLQPDRAQFYAAEVCCGLMHLHQKNIIYRDLKPENILLDDNGHIRISDLGLAVRMTNGSTVRGAVGTLGYMAPEVIGQRQYGLSADWWGLGCLIYEMTNGSPPFHTRGESPKHQEMERRIETEQEEYNERFTREAKDICMQLLNKAPERRMGSRGGGGGGGGGGGREVQSHRYFRTVNFRMLEAGLVQPPFKPDPRQVYCSDVMDIEEFSIVKGVVLDQIDGHFYNKFNTGSVPITWQNEVIDTGCFRELNVFGPLGSRSPDLDWTLAPGSPKRSLLKRIFRRNLSHTPDSTDGSKESLVSPETCMKSGGLLATSL